MKLGMRKGYGTSLQVGEPAELQALYQSFMPKTMIVGLSTLRGCQARLQQNQNKSRPYRSFATWDLREQLIWAKVCILDSCDTVEEDARLVHIGQGGGLHRQEDPSSRDFQTILPNGPSHTIQVLVLSSGLCYRSLHFVPKP